MAAIVNGDGSVVNPSSLLLGTPEIKTEDKGEVFIQAISKAEAIKRITDAAYDTTQHFRRVDPTTGDMDLPTFALELLHYFILPRISRISDYEWETKPIIFIGNYDLLGRPYKWDFKITVKSLKFRYAVVNDFLCRIEDRLEGKAVVLQSSLLQYSFSRENQSNDRIEKEAIASLSNVPPPSPSPKPAPFSTPAVEVPSTSSFSSDLPVRFNKRPRRS